MAGQCQQHFSFKTVQIFKDQTLGTGSYGAVCKAKCDELPCAAKLLYPVLFNLRDPLQAAHNAPPPGRGHRQPLVRFEQECRFLSQIRHPNIILYLGTYHDPDTNAPVLLMELMDESLTHFLETSQGPLLFHVQVNILQDTALAISYLHSNGIIHRDLSSNNVLIIAKSRAKVTDFGMSQLTDAAAPRIASLTLCPGTTAYMSPEALTTPPVYSEKLDCFSFGVLTIQVFTREFPNPTDQFQIKELMDPSNPPQNVSARVVVPEIKRRQSQINLLGQNHPFLPIALDCLKDRDVERPTAQQLCQRLEGLKDSPFYASNALQMYDKNLQAQNQRHFAQHQKQQIQLQAQTETMKTKDQLISSLREENHKLRQQLQCSQSSEQITKANSPVQQLKGQQQQLEEKRELRSRVKSQTFPRKKGAECTLNFKWSKGPNAPCKMTAGSSTTNGNKAYFRPHGSRIIYKYVSTWNGHWSALPECPHCSFTMVIINNLLTAVGGMDGYNEKTNKLLSFKNKKWFEHFPSMAIRRFKPNAVSSEDEVIVAGGTGETGEYLTSVEIMNIHTNNWSTASSLPYGISAASMSTCGEAVFIVGGTTKLNTYSVLTCSLHELLQSSRPAIRGMQVQQQSTSHVQPKVWRNTTNLPVHFSTSVSVNGHLLVIGGKDSQRKRTTAIHMYNSIANSWDIISHLTLARSECMVSILSDRKLMVVGGWIDSSSGCDSRDCTEKVEIATLNVIGQ